MRLADFPPRFSSKVVVLPSGCWEWTAARSKAGYGYYHLDSHKLTYAHRFAYWHVHGWWSSRTDQLDHYRYPDDGCIGTSCANPEHVRPASARENTLRSNAVSAVNLAKRSCDNGHEFNAENTRRDGKTGFRYCIACRREQGGYVAKPPRAERTHCPEGHPYSGDNLYLRPDGRGRDCRTCRREHQREFAKRQRAQRKAGDATR